MLSLYHKHTQGKRNVESSDSPGRHSHPVSTKGLCSVAARSPGPLDGLQAPPLCAKSVDLPHNTGNSRPSDCTATVSRLPPRETAGRGNRTRLPPLVLLREAGLQGGRWKDTWLTLTPNNAASFQKGDSSVLATRLWTEQGRK